MTETSSLRRALPLSAVLLCVILIGTLYLNFSFLPTSEPMVDGFQQQLSQASEVLAGNVTLDIYDGSWLVFVHMVRLAAVTPFLLLESWFEPFAFIFLLCCLAPVVLPSYNQRPSIIRLVPFFLPLLVSGRGVLIAVGVASIILSVYNYKYRYWMLWTGFLWVNLSSASALMSLLLLLFLNPKSQQKAVYRVQKRLVIFLLFISFMASAINKFYGFQSGESGFEAYAFSADNIFLSVLSRSTLFVAFSEGQYLRGFAYLLAAFYAIFNLIYAIIFSRKSGVRAILFCCIPGVFMEGLGVIAFIFPLFWIFVGFTPSSINKVLRSKPLSNKHVHHSAGLQSVSTPKKVEFHEQNLSKS